jgi:hypothetical protein
VLRVLAGQGLKRRRSAPASIAAPSKEDAGDSTEPEEQEDEEYGRQPKKRRVSKSKESSAVSEQKKLHSELRCKPVALMIDYACSLALAQLVCHARLRSRWSRKSNRVVIVSTAGASWMRPAAQKTHFSVYTRLRACFLVSLR